MGPVKRFDKPSLSLGDIRMMQDSRLSEEAEVVCGSRIEGLHQDQSSSQICWD